MKSEFDLVLYDDEIVRGKLQFMGALEAAFDDSRNDIPDTYYFFADRLPLGSHIRITIELLTLRDEQEKQA